MELLINLSKSLVSYMSVDLRSAYVAVAEHHLYRSKVRSIGQQVGGKAVSKHVWGYVSDSRLLTI